MTDFLYSDCANLFDRAAPRTLGFSDEEINRILDYLYPVLASEIEQLKTLIRVKKFINEQSSLSLKYETYHTRGIEMKKERPWKNRKFLKEVTMPDGFKLTFWLYEWNDNVALRLKHRFCVRIRKLNPEGRPLPYEQIGVRIDNWNTFLDTVNKLKID